MAPPVKFSPEYMSKVVNEVDRLKTNMTGEPARAGVASYLREERLSPEKLAYFRQRLAKAPTNGNGAARAKKKSDPFVASGIVAMPPKGKRLKLLPGWEKILDPSGLPRYAKKRPRRIGLLPINEYPSSQPAAGVIKSPAGLEETSTALRAACQQRLAVLTAETIAIHEFLAKFIN